MNWTHTHKMRFWYLKGISFQNFWHTTLSFFWGNTFSQVQPIPIPWHEVAITQPLILVWSVIFTLNHCEFHTDFVNKTNCLLFDPTFCTHCEAHGLWVKLLEEQLHSWYYNEYSTDQSSNERTTKSAHKCNHNSFSTLPMKNNSKYNVVKVGHSNHSMSTDIIYTLHIKMRTR